jgi:probable addiction module antidote protein
MTASCFSAAEIKVLRKGISRERADSLRSGTMKAKRYDNELLHDLRDPGEAARYLNACLEESDEVFLLGLRHVVEASGGIGGLSKKTELDRVNLYRTLSKRGNPKLSSLSAILEAVGIELRFRAVR